MKFTKTQEKSLTEFIQKADPRGCLSKKEWITGHGRYTNYRTLPPFVTEVSRSDLFNNTHKYSTYVAMAAAQFFGRKENARKELVLVLEKSDAVSFFFNSALGQEIN